jgi:hypothetical protein
MREVGEDGVVRRVQDPHFKRFPISKNPKQFEIQRKVNKWNAYIRVLDLNTIIGWIDKNKTEILNAIDGGLCDAEFEKLVLLDSGTIQLDIVKKTGIQVTSRRVPLGPNGGLEFIIQGAENLPSFISDETLLTFAVTSVIHSAGIDPEAVEEFQRVITRLREEMRHA